MSLYKQYLDVKKQYPDALVFYRVGDFYELFGADAITASGILDLVLTSRDCGLPERVPMCGVPYHSVDLYIAKLVKDGYKTAICEPAKIIQEPMKLNLTATGTEQTLIKEYLEKNASQTLIEKINSGVKIVKDGATLVSKKTLETFLAYACEEARKLAEKGARAAAVKSDTVFGWAIHYFEENSIEGTLYNEDGTEFKPKPAPRTNTANPTKAVVATKPQPAQSSFFELLETPSSTPAEEAETAEAEETEIDEVETDDCEKTEEVQNTQDYPQGLIQVSETQWVDRDGVIYDNPKNKVPDALNRLFDGKIVVR